MSIELAWASYAKAKNLPTMSRVTHKVGFGADTSMVNRTDDVRPRRLSFGALRRIVARRLPHRWWFALIPILVVLLLLASRLRGSTPIAVQPFDTLDADALQITAPTTINVGDPIEITVSGASSDSPITLVVDSGYGLRQFIEAPVSGDATFAIPSLDVPASGVMTFTALASGETGRGSVVLVPGDAVDPLEILLGPRTIETGRNFATMIVVIPQDSLGNPLIDGTAVDVAVTRPDLTVDDFDLSVTSLLAWSRIESETTAGRSRVGVQVGDARGEEINFLEVAGTPTAFQVEVIDPIPRADGRSIMRVRTTELSDRFGNVVPDGNSVFADIEGSNGTRRLRAQVIKGQAEFTIEAPSRPGIETIVVNASGAISTPLELEFLAMVDDFPVTVTGHADGSLVQVGPVISVLGAFIPDGTPVIVTTADGEFVVPSFEGLAEIIVPPGSDAQSVSILGAETVVAEP